MGIRSLQQLRIDQAATMARLDAERADDADVVGAESLHPTVTIGTVTGLVFFSQYGNHLLVQPQEFKATTGAPVVVPAQKPQVRAYPSPPLTIFAYGVGEFVTLGIARGALLAFKIP